MMLRFAHPLWLLTALLIPLWVWARVSPRLRTLLHYPSALPLRQLPRSPARRLHPLLPFIGALGLLSLVLALARPQSGLRQRNVKTEAIDIVLALDSSTSMEAIDLGEREEKNRLEVVKEVAERFISGREGDRIALIDFAAVPYTKSPLSRDHAWLIERLREMRSGALPDGTALGTALASAVNRLRESESASRVVVLLTDGISNAGDIEPLEAAALAEKLGIRVYTVGAGAEGPVRYPAQDFFGRRVYVQREIPIDEATLTRVAQVTGGRYFRARNQAELDATFAEIDQLERTEIELNEFTLYTEQFVPLAALGLGLLLLERLLAAGRLGRTLA